MTFRTLIEMGYPSSPNGFKKYIKENTDWEVTNHTKGKVPNKYDWITITNGTDEIEVNFYRDYTKASYTKGKFVKSGTNANEINVTHVKKISMNVFVSEVLKDFKIQESEHKYSENTLAELELLLKHHKEDYKEGECPKEIMEDIKEIESAIKAKS